MNEEEFYDAIETALDRQDEEEATMVGVLIICFILPFKFIITIVHPYHVLCNLKNFFVMNWFTG